MEGKYAKLSPFHVDPEKIEAMFREEIAGYGAVRETLRKYLA